MGSLLYTLFVRFLLIIISIMAFIPVCCMALMSRERRLNSSVVYWIVHWFYWIILKCSLLPITYEGLHNVPDEPAIFVANHQSSLDIPLVGILAGKKAHIWLARQDLVTSPILRFVLPIFTILTDVTSIKSSVRSLRFIISLLLNKPGHLMIFPEGSRFDDGKIHEFFSGFVILAKKLKRPVVPVFIQDAYKIYPRGAFLLKRGKLTVIVGVPFVYHDFDTDETFKKRVYQWFLDQVEA